MAHFPGHQMWNNESQGHTDTGVADETPPNTGKIHFLCVRCDFFIYLLFSLLALWEILQAGFECASLEHKSKSFCFQLYKL